jgi:hypothetical protein
MFARVNIFDGGVSAMRFNAGVDLLAFGCGVVRL